LEFGRRFQLIGQHDLLLAGTGECPTSRTDFQVS